MKMIVATHNKHKIEEFKRILEPMGFEVCTAELTEAEENGTTFAANAYIKAKSACDETGLPCIADDSGLCVEYLHGAPGVYSARYAPNDNGKYRVLEEMKDVPMEQRDAYFESAISCVFPDGSEIACQGRCYGKIDFELKGDGGFGYDPIFLVGEKTFGEMTAEEKAAVSHRGVALRIFEEKLKEKLGL